MCISTVYGVYIENIHVTSPLLSASSVFILNRLWQVLRQPCTVTNVPTSPCHTVNLCMLNLPHAGALFMLKYNVQFYKYTRECMIFAVHYMLSIDSACGVLSPVSSHSDCLTGQTDCGLDQRSATRPRGPFLGQQTRAGSVGHLSSWWKAQCSHNSGQTPKHV